MTVDHSPLDHANRLVKLVRRAATTDAVVGAVAGAVGTTKKKAAAAAATTAAKSAAKVADAATTAVTKAKAATAAAVAGTSAVGTDGAAVSAATTKTKATKSKATAATTAPTTAPTTTATTAAATTSAVTKAKATTATSALTSSSAIAGAANNNLASSGSSSTGAVAGGVIAGVVVLGAIAGFFVYRRVKANRAARAGSSAGLVGGAGAFKKHNDEDDDEMFGNSSSGSAFGGEKSGFSGPHDTYNSTAGGPVLAPGSWAAQEAQMRQTAAQPVNNNTRPPSWGQHPYANNGQPTSQNMNSYPPPQSPYADDANAAAVLPTIVENGPEAAAAAAGGVTPFHDGAGGGEVYLVKRTFEPSLDDELVLFPGDRIQVQVKYDDGWAFGMNLDSGSPSAKGVFPFDCLGDLAPNGGAGPRAQSPAANEKNSFENRANSPAGNNIGGKTSPSPYQLPTIRSDSPFNAAPPAIRLEDDTGRPRSLVVAGEPNKRTSSLIASRDADLFMALGEVLDKGHQQQ